jgi:steroid delta-isomerase-like uncharacterized protein
MGTIDDGKALARREIEEFEGRGDLALAGTLFGPGYALHFPGFPPLDRTGHEQVIGAFREAFPDLTISVAEQVGSIDHVANHWVAHGTHRGPFQGIPATGKAVRISGNNVMRLEGGRIVELWGQLDAVGLLAQLGVIPAPPPEPVPEAFVRGGRARGGGVEVVRRFASKFNQGRLDTIADEYADGYVLDFPGGPAGHGKEGLRRATTEFRAAFPDLFFTTDDLFEEGDRVAWRWTMTGTHRGPLGPFPASGRNVRLPGISVFQLEDGLIARDRVRADMAGLLTQIGAIPEAPARSDTPRSG